MKPNIDSEAFKNAVSVQRMRESDAYTIAHHTAGRELMLRAATGVFNAVEWSGKTVTIVAGSGNNGGDGYALAGLLADAGVSVCVCRTSGKLSADGAFYFRKAVEKGVPINDFAEGGTFGGIDILVDCIFGTGFSGTPRGLPAAAIRAVNDSSAYVVSVDINSGLNGDTGEAELAVRSDLTVSIGFYKTGHFLGRAPELIGDLVNVDIGIVLV